MIYPLNPVLMELLVLAMISREDSYGYQISQQMKTISNLKDSALYPVLRRLAQNHYVDIYDRQFQGRNRKYYRITEVGRRQKEFLEQEWNIHVQSVQEILNSGHKTEGTERVQDAERVKLTEKANVAKGAEAIEAIEAEDLTQGIKETEPAEATQSAKETETIIATEETIATEATEEPGRVQAAKGKEATEEPGRVQAAKGEEATEEPGRVQVMKEAEAAERGKDE